MAIVINPNQSISANFISDKKTPVNNPNPQNQRQKSMISTEDKPLAGSVSKINPKGDVLEIKDNGKKTEKISSAEKIEKSKPTEVKPVKPALVDAKSEGKVEPKAVNNDSVTNESLVAKTYNAVSRTSSLAKSVVDGVLSGLVFGTLAAGVDMVYSGIKKFKNKEIKFVQMFNPKKAMTRLGRNMSYVCAVGIMAGTIAAEYMQANKKRKKQTVDKQWEIRE